ncbi:exo-alpha-sialidase [Helicobacter pametensis]|uniref:exo-alpha-sialidase n=1 Tax=Helicobacter pametensis TaxID=95149 RepID=UPI0004B83593|nr:sialidase family protein [Helicobacter pametensis]
MSRIVFYIVLCVLAFVAFRTHKEAPPPFFQEVKMRYASEVPMFIKTNLPSITKAPSVHSASIAHLDDRRMIAVWFGGSGEGRPDVEIYKSIYTTSSNLWSEPQSILTRKKLKEDSHQFIKKLGNPVIYKSANGDLHLFVVGVTFGGWATSKIYHYISKDDANSFQYAGLLELGGFMNLSHLVRSNPVSLEDGGFYLPVYHELADKYPLIVRFDREGRMLYSQKLTALKGQLQPSIVALDSKQCLVTFRSYRSKEMYMQTCQDGGLHWDKPIATNLINEGSSIAMFKMDQDVFLIHNTREKSPKEARGTLVLSKLVGEKWEKVAILDVAQGERKKDKSVEVSYPNVLVTGDTVNVVYTNNRTHISHLRFNHRWILDQLKGGQK